MQTFNPGQIAASARSALQPSLMITMGGTVLGAVLLFALFGLDSEVGGAGSLLMHAVGALACLFWVLFGLTALSHQLHMQAGGHPVPDPLGAAGFAWSRVQPLMLLPVWAAGALLALLLAEMFILLLAHIPGLGLLWLVLAGLPLLLLNTVLAVVLLLAVFNIAARVAMSDADAAGLAEALWKLLRQRLPELLIYNLGGVVASLLVLGVLLSPLWLGAQMTWAMMDVISGDALQRVIDGIGFWGWLGHLFGLLLLGGLLAAVAGVPCIVITHMTLLLHLELDRELDREQAMDHASDTAAGGSMPEEGDGETDGDQPDGRPSHEKESQDSDEDDGSNAGDSGVASGADNGADSSKGATNTDAH